MPELEYLTGPEFVEELRCLLSPSNSLPMLVGGAGIMSAIAGLRSCDKCRPPSPPSTWKSVLRRQGNTCVRIVSCSCLGNSSFICHLHDVKKYFNISVLDQKLRLYTSRVINTLTPSFLSSEARLAELLEHLTTCKVHQH